MGLENMVLQEKESYNKGLSQLYRAVADSGAGPDPSIQDIGKGFSSLNPDFMTKGLLESDDSAGISRYIFSALAEKETRSGEQSQVTKSGTNKIYGCGVLQVNPRNIEGKEFGSLPASIQNAKCKKYEANKIRGAADGTIMFRRFVKQVSKGRSKVLSKASVTTKLAAVFGSYNGGLLEASTISELSQILDKKGQTLITGNKDKTTSNRVENMQSIVKAVSFFGTDEQLQKLFDSPILVSTVQYNKWVKAKTEGLSDSDSKLAKQRSSLFKHLEGMKGIDFSQRYITLSVWQLLGERRAKSSSTIRDVMLENAGINKEQFLELVKGK